MAYEFKVFAVWLIIEPKGICKMNRVASYFDNWLMAAPTCQDVARHRDTLVQHLGRLVFQDKSGKDHADTHSTLHFHWSHSGLWTVKSFSVPRERRDAVRPSSFSEEA